MRNLKKDEVEFSVEIEWCDIPVRGNYMCTDDLKADKEAENDIIRRVNLGQVEAWCDIKVTAKWETFSAFAFICGSSFSEDEKDLDKQIKDSAEEHGLFEEALDQLNKEVRAYVMNAHDIEIKLAE